ncbi:hypothetical protein NTE_00674 [Candidatus Nitrososphaera evergladensis SR1]|uniref:Uncharacterized protein n=1 Tax=Candidatus Nitrososphaera evergladensis SR1 TaxID=1459636 RepID=A0A075MU12_9ARCH|nr:hypothetical protein NTE_00674 [Candidatus Nitrososphaera evergladensis SR1]
MNRKIVIIAAIESWQLLLPLRLFYHCLLSLMQTMG